MLNKEKNIVCSYGLAHIYNDNTILDVWYPDLSSRDTEDHKLYFKNLINSCSQTNNLLFKNIKKKLIFTSSNIQETPSNIEDIYIRLHLISQRLMLPNTINLDNIFEILPNIIWTNRGPLPILDKIKRKLFLENSIYILSIDKFPPMLNYVIPSNIRIANADRVRLGAYLSAGTTVMHEGFINFNAGTLGPCMVEGRISSGVIVDKNTDIGGGASIMGTLSGGGKHKIHIGKRVLLGANSGLGISLGDDCVVEAGLYITSGTKVHLIDKKNKCKKILKALHLSNTSNLLFRRNSINGKVEALKRCISKNSEFKNKSKYLNKALHVN